MSWVMCHNYYDDIGKPKQTNFVCYFEEFPTKSDGRETSAFPSLGRDSPSFTRRRAHVLDWTCYLTRIFHNYHEVANVVNLGIEGFFTAAKKSYL